ncbi:MAG: DUF2931 family protein [Ectopseudomonas guguanensis]|jgi:hypothetical protein|uniref:DUF2931 family protein n=1 Tax=Ectopseudomonas guguanensis TaxID=1198456 RepID=UPI003918B384
MRTLLFCFVLGLLAGCAHADKGPGSLPYKYWRLGFLAPDYMEVWVETADVEDIRGQKFFNVGSGTVSVHLPKDGSGNARGWGERFGWGAGRYVNGADLPKRLYVRWQSLAEPQTYSTIVEIPERARQLMSERLEKPCPTIAYRHALAIGLAPGGVIRGWVMSTCDDPIEVFRAQAAVEPKGPSQGKTNGQYALPLEPESRAYIEQHGIPYGSW